MRFRTLILLSFLFPLPAVAQDLPDTTPETALRQTLNDARARFHKCYVDHVPAASRVNNGDTARLNIRILENGRVDSVFFTDTTIQTEAARTCVLDVARTLDFRVRSARTLIINVWLGLDSALPNLVTKLMDPPTQRVSTADLLEVVRTNHRHLNTCYQNATTTERVSIVVNLVIDAQGKASSIKISDNSLEDTAFASCIQGVFESLSFPAVGKDAPVLLKVPLSFETR